MCAQSARKKRVQMELQTSKVDLLLDVDQKPELWLFLVCSTFAMFKYRFSAVNIGGCQSIGCFICVRIRTLIHSCDAV